MYITLVSAFAAARKKHKGEKKDNRPQIGPDTKTISSDIWNQKNFGKVGTWNRPQINCVRTYSIVINLGLFLGYSLIFSHLVVKSASLLSAAIAKKL